MRTRHCLSYFSLLSLTFSCLPCWLAQADRATVDVQWCRLCGPGKNNAITNTFTYINFNFHEFGPQRPHSRCSFQKNVNRSLSIYFPERPVLQVLESEPTLRERHPRSERVSQGWGASTYESTSRQNSQKLKLNFNNFDKLKRHRLKANRLYNLQRILLLRCQFSIYGFLPKKKKCIRW